MQSNNPRLHRLHLAIAAPLLAMALAGPALADPIQPGQTLHEQRYEWQRAYSRRWDGTYSQYEISMQAGTRYEISVSNPHSAGLIQFATTYSDDTYLYLLDSTSGAIAAEDDDSGGSRQARIVYTPASSGVFLIRLRAYRRGTYGLCSLSVTASGSQPISPPPPSSAAISPGDALADQYFAWESSYSSRSAGDYAAYDISMAAGAEYVISTSDAHGGTTDDTYLYLLDGSGRIAAEDDDSGPGRLSRIRFRPRTTGVYTIKLRAYRRGRYGLCTLAVSGPSGGGGSPRYPDIITWRDAMEDADIIDSGREKLLRFSNAPTNIGAGPLEVYGIVESDGTTYAYQRIWNDNGTFTDREAGTFSFAGHQDHNHWHFDDFAEYNLRAVAADGGVGDVVATSGKVTFCLEDSVPYDRSLPGAPSREVYSCDHQGISVGWADVYRKDLEGQNIRITSIPDGVYWLESISDPDNRLVELDDSNNTARIKIRIVKASNSVTILE